MTRPEPRAAIGIVVSAIALALAISAACGPASRPAEGPGTSYPCGVWGVECSNGACCPWAHVCGVEGDPYRRCEVGYCCAEADPLYGTGRDGGAPRIKARSPR